MTDPQIQKEAKKSKVGKKVLNFFIKEANRKKLNRYRKDRVRTRIIRQVSREQESHLDDILRNVLKHIMPVTQSLVLMPQVRYSGGFLLNRLFDGHPEVHALPHEIGTRATAAGPWPEIDLDDKPRDWFEALFREVDSLSIQKKFSSGDRDRTAMPFVFLPLIQEQIFLKYLESVKMIRQRDVIDAYITASFGAWLDYQNLSGEKKFTTANAPDLAMQQESIENFFEIYPEGRLISIVRNPEDWLACARTHEPEIYRNVCSDVNRWKASVRAVLEINRKFKDRVCLIRFEDLVNCTDAVMHYVSSFLKISFNDILLKPSFNSISLQSSNSPETNRTEAAAGYLFDAKALDQSHRIIIKEKTQEEYATILEEVVAI